MITVDINKFDYSLIDKIKIAKHKGGNPGSKSKKRFKNIICAFDIETSVLPNFTIKDKKQSIMYIWQFAFSSNICIIGRTWDEFIEFKRRVSEHLKQDEYLLIFTHNLSYEFQWLKSVLHFNTEDVFCIDARKIARASCWPFEFRCSYIHSAQNLDQYLKAMQVKDLKQSGVDFDYKAVRYPWTKLTDQQLKYCINDVIGLVEAIETDMKIDNDSFYSFPLTSTGYVRRDVKKAMRDSNHYLITNAQPDIETYHLLRAAFRGGNTHANPWKAGLMCTDVHCIDRSSSYPDVLINCKFPVTSFQRIKKPSMRNLTQLLNNGKAVLMDVTFIDIEIDEDNDCCPYIPISKCHDALDCDIDNGRVIQASELSIALTDIDLKIIRSMYHFSDMIVNQIEYATYGELPTELKNCINEYYTKKTTLKGTDESFEYKRSKRKLNSIYGFMRQDPVKQLVTFNGVDYDLHNDDEAEILAKHNKYNTYSLYQWGVWCTRWARLRLQEAIDIVGNDFVYCDTDSVFYQNKHNFDDYNKQRIKDSTINNAYAIDSKGVTHYMGVLEPDKECVRFKTLGAKKYVYEDKKGNLHITISGVSKTFGATELADKGGIEAFAEGFTFTNSGKIEATYNDQTTPFRIAVDGGEIDIYSNVVLEDSTYTLSISDEYKELLQNMQKFNEILKYVKDNNL